MPQIRTKLTKGRIQGSLYRATSVPLDRVSFLLILNQTDNKSIASVPLDRVSFLLILNPTDNKSTASVPFSMTF